MNKVSRNTFLRQMGVISMAGPFSSYLNTNKVGEDSGAESFDSDESLFQRLVKANDEEVRKLLKAKDKGKNRYIRRLADDFATLAASCCCPGSAYYQNSQVVTQLENAAQLLLDAQLPDGTINAGNLGSPPDTAFVLWPTCAGMSVLMKDQSKALNNVKEAIKKFILNAGEACVVGGVHTANHRWVISAALALINALYPDRKYVDRINDWLGEGIFNDKDGHFQERSRNYSEVIDTALIVLSRLLNRDDLLEPVRSNLEMTYYYMEPDGELVTTDARRQDQYSSISILAYYKHYRYLAIKDKNSMFAAITELIENFDGFEEQVLSHSLVDFLEVPLLQKDLPARTSLPVNYEKFMETTSLARIRREKQTTTIFGGVDWPLIIASGRSTNPNFFSFRKGSAILKYMRLSPRFFSTGYFRSDGLKKEDSKYILYKKLEVPYYQPLPKDKRKKDGDYKLSESIDGRFWNKMDFEDRPVSNVKTLETTITVEEPEGKNEVSFYVSGSENVLVTLELCFKEGGELQGIIPSNDNPTDYFLKEGMGKYQYGDDFIQFGPGTFEHQYIHNLESEDYHKHFGSLRTDGMHVYLTGKTPFSHKLTFA